MTEWHADRALLDRYTAGEAAPVLAASVEAHLVTCADCRAAVASSTDSHRLDALWAEVVDVVDRPRPTAMERVLTSAGVPGRTARLLATAPSLRPPWLAAVAATLVLAVLAAAEQATNAAFLVVAPVLPLVGVAAAYGAADPVDELVATTPTGRFELLLLRSTVVLGVTVSLGAIAAFFLPAGAATTWLLPALALTATSVAASSFVEPARAAAALIVAWLSVTVALPAFDRPRGAIGQAISESVAFRSLGQLACLAAMAGAFAVIVGRRNAFDLRRR